MENDKIKINEIKNLSNDHYKLEKVNFNYLTKNGVWQEQSRECYDRGDGAAILLYNLEKRSVILTKQFRMPTFLNNHSSGMMIEVCAGLLDKNDPLTCIKNEAIEETGYAIETPVKVFELFSTPGAVTEKIHYFIGQYTDKMKVGDGGGLEDETEEIEVVEYKFDTAYKMIATGEILDAKTVVLLQYAKLELAL